MVWRSLASEDPECPLLVKKASDTLMERLKDPKTHDAITKDFKYCDPMFQRPKRLRPKDLNA